MRDPDTLALYDALGPDDRAALDAVLAEQPALADALARWRSLRAGVRADLSRALPDRALLVLYALGDDDEILTDDERQRLDAARPALEAALDRHPGLAAAVRRIRADRDAFDAAWNETARTPLTLVETPRARRPATDRPAVRRVAPGRPLRWVSRAAAVLAVVAFGALATWLSVRDAGWETVAGGQTVTLADGTTIDLADGARLMIREDRGRRAQLVAGDALFRVARNEAEPFEVTTLNAEVTVLGTTFAVEATDVETEVTLVEGVVTLAPRAQPDRAVRLAPGQQSRVRALDAPSEPEAVDVAALAWEGPEFERYITAGEVVRQLGAAFDVSVAIDSVLADEQVSVFDYRSLGIDSALDVLADAIGATVEAEGEGFRVAY